MKLFSEHLGNPYTSVSYCFLFAHCNMKLNEYTLLVLHTAVAFFSVATLAFDIYTVCQSLGWPHSFAHLYNYGSSE